MSFSAQLLRDHVRFWEGWQPHPLTRGVAEATLPAGVFHRWLAQDYLFVSEGLRFLGVLLSKAPPRLLEPMADTIAAWKVELGRFREQAEADGVALDVPAALVTRAYLDFLLATAHQCPFPTGWAVLFGVERAYHDAWRWVAERAAPDNPYRHWIDNWASEAFGAFVAFLAETLDALAVDLPPDVRAEIQAKFTETARFEALFWDMAWRGDTWEGGA